MLNLVIVESAAKARTISKYLNSIASLKSKGEFNVIACLGHIQDLPSKTLGIDKTTWEVTYEINSKKKDILQKITVYARQALKSGGKVYIASDMDVEGNAIASHIKLYLGLNNRCQYDRVVFNEITQSALENAFLNPVEIDQRAVEAQETRRILDRIIGYELSPLLWRRFKRQNLSAGRVQSAALHIIVTRHNEMLSHLYTPFWKLIGSFGIESTIGVIQLKASGVHLCTTAKDALIILQSVVNELEWYASFTKSASNKSPPPPFITSTLQQICFQRYGLSATSTMQIAQSLYEAGAITYMRTDSTNISEEMKQMISNNIRDTYGASYARSKETKRSKSSGNVQGAHEAIRPTSFTTRNLAESHVQSDFKDIHQKVYDLIWKRTVASQMADAVYARISYNIQSNSNLVLHGSCNILTFNGYQIIYNDDTSDDDQDIVKSNHENMSFWDVLLNTYSSKTPVKPICFDMVPDVERPKPLFNEATLVKEMEKEGIGRPSTYASVLNKLYDKKYIENGSNIQYSVDLESLTFTCHNRKEKEIKSTCVRIHVGGNEKNKMVPTSLGCKVVEYIDGITPYLLDCKFTRTMETDLDKIAHDDSMSLKKNILNDFYNVFSKSCATALQHSIKPVETKEVSVELACIRDFPHLNASIKNTKYGPAIYVSNKKGTDIVSVTPFLEWRSIRIDDLTDVDIKFITSLPRKIPGYTDGVLAMGRYGLYIKSKKNMRLDQCLWQKCYEGSLTGEDILRENSKAIASTEKKKQKRSFATRP